MDIPAIVVMGGPMLGGIEFDGRKADFTSTDEAKGMYSVGKITKEEYRSWKIRHVPVAVRALS